MPRIGEYETVAELRRTALHRVYLARRIGEGEGAVVMKVLDPAVPLPRKETQAREQGMRERAMLQSDLAHASSAWVAVEADQGTLAGGRDEEQASVGSMETLLGRPEMGGRGDRDPLASPKQGRGVAFVVYEHAGESPARLVERGTRFDAAGLWRVAEGVLDGLDVLDRSRGRGHGQLTEGNVLIRSAGGGTKGLARARVALTDPLTDSEAKAAEERGRNLHAADARALGRLLFALVEGRSPSNAEAREGLGHSAAWASLGRAGRRWRGVCDTLLAAGREGEWTLIDTRRALKAGRPGWWRRWLRT